MKFTGLFFICMFALLALIVSARHMEDSFESAQLMDFEDGSDDHNYRGKRDEQRDFPSFFQRGHRRGFVPLEEFSEPEYHTSSNKVRTKKDLYLSTCARMDIGWDTIAEGACSSACWLKNCGNGHCERRYDSRAEYYRWVCVCSRCGNGSNVGVGINIGNGK